MPSVAVSQLRLAQRTARCICPWLMKRLIGMVAFVKAVDTGNFTGVAIQLASSQSLVSKKNRIV